jgi:hypothetical protein
MESSERRSRTWRRYPPLWEWVIPIVLTLIVLAIVTLLVVSVGIVVGWFPIDASLLAGSWLCVA